MNAHPISTRPLLHLVPFFLAGVAAGAHLPKASAWLWAGAALAAGLLGFQALKGRTPGLWRLGVAFCLLGAAASAASFSPPRDAGHVYQWRGRAGLVFGGRIAGPPRVRDGRVEVLVDTDEVIPRDRAPLAVRGRVRLTAIGDGTGLTAGDRVRFPAVLREPAGFRNPGGFDYQRYLAGRGIWVTGFLKTTRLLVRVGEGLEKSAAGPSIGRIRRSALDFIDSSVGRPARGLFKAMLLGDQGDIQEHTRNVFRRLGLAHLLAISGLHVGLMAVIGFWAARRLLLLWPPLALRLNVRRASALAAFVPVLAYAALAGGRPSTVRAAIMVGVFLLAQLTDRMKDPLTALAAAAWMILIVQPGAIFTASFQLSFAAAGSIIVLAPRWPARVFQPQPEDEGSVERKRTPWLPVSAAVSLAALIGTAPIIAVHFQTLAPLTLPANLILTPIISMLVVPPGLAALALGAVFPWGGRIILQTIEVMLWLIFPAMERAAAIPWAEIGIPAPSPWFIAAYYLALAAVFLVRPWRKKVFLAAAVLGLYGLCLVPGHWQTNKPELRITFLDVGQGGAAHVSLPGDAEMMIDGGGFPGSDFDPGENIITPYLLNQGVTRLDVLVLSHPQADHVKGLVYLADHFKPREFWSTGVPSRNRDYGRLCAMAKRRGINRPVLETLRRPRPFGPAVVRVLAPPEDALIGLTGKSAERMQNDLSLVVKVELGAFACLFTGDLEGRGVFDLVKRHGSGLKATVLAAPHHGASASLTPELLDAVRPEIIVVSVGLNNRYGFPGTEALERAKKRGIRVLRTDRHGAVTLITDGKKMRVETCRPAE